MCIEQVASCIPRCSYDKEECSLSQQYYYLTWWTVKESNAIFKRHHQEGDVTVTADLVSTIATDWIDLYLCSWYSVLTQVHSTFRINNTCQHSPYLNEINQEANL